MTTMKKALPLVALVQYAQLRSHKNPVLTQVDELLIVVITQRQLHLNANSNGSVYGMFAPVLDILLTAERRRPVQIH